MKYSKIKVKELLSGDLGNVSTDENYNNLLFNNNVSNNLLLEDICFENCMFDNIDFGNIKLVNVSFVNCYLKNCDLSNQVFDKKCLYILILTADTDIPFHTVESSSSIGYCLNMMHGITEIL